MSNSDLPLSVLLDELHAILIQERQVLLAGKADAIQAMTQRKLGLAARLEELGISRDEAPQLALAQRLARLNRENFVICSAMLRHMTAALDRLTRREPHRSYRPDGGEAGPTGHRLVGAA